MTDEADPIRRGQDALTQSIASFAATAEARQLVAQCAGSCPRQRRRLAELAPYLLPGTTWGGTI